MDVVIGDRIREARLAAGLTQSEVVTRLSALDYTLTKAGLSKYELGKSVPKVTFLVKLSQALAVPMLSFFEARACLTPQQLMRMPADQRGLLLEMAAEKAADLYAPGSELMDFELVDDVVQH